MYIFGIHRSHGLRHSGGAMLREACDLSSPAVAMVHRGERVIVLKEAPKTRWPPVAPGAKVEISMDFMMKTMNIDESLG